MICIFSTFTLEANILETVGVISLGCSKNRVDTELMLGILRDHGYTITADEREADILIVNTCGFIDPAKQESIETLLSLAKYKKTGKCKLLVATGCLVQRYEKDLLTELTEVDLFMGVSQYPQLPSAIAEALHGKRESHCEFINSILTGERVLTTAPYSAYIRIADGCDNCCSYCAIPLIRGGFRSREMDDVLAEIKTLANQGVKEHVLVAQDTSRFGIDKVGHSLLPELMVKAADIPGVEWLRVLYCYPDEIDETLLTAMSSRDNICKYLDLPLQHADPDMLVSMNRRGNIQKTRALLKKAQEMGFTLRTTFITGFPGETDAQFERLMDFVNDIQFDRLGAFAYSPEEDTPASVMDNQLPEEVKQARLDTLMTRQQAISLHRNELRVGTVEKVLIESISEGIARGRSAWEAPETDGNILFPCDDDSLIGEFVTVKLTKALPYDLEGVKL